MSGLILDGLAPFMPKPKEVTPHVETEKVCGSCRYLGVGGGDLECRNGPPHATILLVPAPPPRVGTVMPQVVTSFPLVRPDQWCGKWERQKTT